MTAQAALARQVLLNALVTAQRAAAKRSTLPALGYLLLEADQERQVLRAAGTDLEMALRVEVQATVEGDWQALVPPAFVDWVRALPNGVVTVHPRERGGVLARSGASEGEFAGPPVEEFPVLRMEVPAEAVRLTAEEVKTIARAVGVAAADRDEAQARPVLGTVYLHEREGRLVAAASDGYRLAVWRPESEAPAGLEVLMPLRILKEAAHLGGDVRFGVDEQKRVVMEIGGWAQLSGLTVDGQYPNFWQILPQQGFKLRVEVDRRGMAAALRQVAVFALESPVVQMEVGANQVTLKKQGVEVGQGTAVVPARVSGLQEERFQIAANVEMLMDGVDAWDEERLVMQFNHPLGPFQLWEGAYLYLQMPMSLP